jgi:hypothetical protein
MCVTRFPSLVTAQEQPDPMENFADRGGWFWVK